MCIYVYIHIHISYSYTYIHIFIYIYTRTHARTHAQRHIDGQIGFGEPASPAQGTSPNPSIQLSLAESIQLSLSDLVNLQALLKELLRQIRPQSVGYHEAQIRLVRPVRRHVHHLRETSHEVGVYIYIYV